MYVYSERNQVAIYVASLGAEICQQLYTLPRLVEVVEELLSQVLGFGHLDPQYLDV